MSNENLYLYILMRTDLPSMGAGRAAAQASHASNAFIHKFGEREDVVEWSHQTPQGFGTAIVLSASHVEIAEILNECNDLGIDTIEKVVDPDYVIPISSEIVPFLDPDNGGIIVEQSATDPNKSFIHRSEVTCAYVFGDKEKLAPILGKLSLYS